MLADEPTAALDSTSGHTVMELLQRLARDANRAVVIVTHDARMQSYAIASSIWKTGVSSRISACPYRHLKESAHETRIAIHLVARGGRCGDCAV